MWKFITENWLDILLVIVGASAFVTYILQERRKYSEAASLIILQVENLQKRIAEIGSFIVDGKLNESAFYESQMLFKTDYWDKYKHYFIRKMDAFSFSSFDEFNNCASEILEQQQLMKNLQKNTLFLTQQTLMQMESNSIMCLLSICNQNSANMQQLLNAIESIAPEEMDPEQKNALINMLKLSGESNQDINWDAFWNTYNKSKDNLHKIINQGALTQYIPVQIRVTLENALKKCNTIQIIGCNGYNKLKKIAERKF